MDFGFPVASLHTWLFGIVQDAYGQRVRSAEPAWFVGRSTDELDKRDCVTNGSAQLHTYLTRQRLLGEGIHTNRFLLNCFRVHDPTVGIISQDPTHSAGHSARKHLLPNDVLGYRLCSGSKSGPSDISPHGGKKSRGASWSSYAWTERYSKVVAGTRLKYEG